MVGARASSSVSGGALCGFWEPELGSVVSVKFAHPFTHFLLTPTPSRPSAPGSWWLSGKESACNVGESGSIPGTGRSSGVENDNPLQCS